MKYNISELKPSMRSVDLDVTVKGTGKSAERYIESQGLMKKVRNCVIEDESGLINMSVWGDQGDELHPNDALHIKNASVGEFGGLRCVNVGFYSLLKKQEKEDE